MDLATAPSPKNKAIQLKELPSHRAIARYLHGPPQHGPLMVAGAAGGAAAHLPLAGLLGLRAPRPHPGCSRDAPRSRYRAHWEAAAAHGREPAEPRADVAEPRVRRPVLNRLADLQAGFARRDAGEAKERDAASGQRAVRRVGQQQAQHGSRVRVPPLAVVRLLREGGATCCGSGPLGTPRKRPRHCTSSHGLGCSSAPPAKPPIPTRFDHPATVIVMHRFPAWMPSLFRVSDLIVRISEAGDRP